MQIKNIKLWFFDLPAKSSSFGGGDGIRHFLCLQEKNENNSQLDHNEVDN